jgi:hypothetical protein
VMHLATSAAEVTLPCTTVRFGLVIGWPAPASPPVPGGITSLLGSRASTVSQGLDTMSKQSGGAASTGYWYTMSKQSDGTASTGAPVHYEQIVRSPSPHPRVHLYAMSKQSATPHSSRWLTGR